MSKPVFLKIYKDQQLVGVKQFRAKQIAIGSGDVDVSLEGLSFLHACIEKKDDGRYFLVCEAGLKPEVFINGQQVSEHPLSSQEVFQIGNYQIEFFEGFPKSTATGPTTLLHPATPPQVPPSQMPPSVSPTQSPHPAPQQQTPISHVPPVHPTSVPPTSPQQVPPSHIPPASPTQPPVPPTQQVVPQHPTPPQAPVSHVPPVHPTPPQQVPPSHIPPVPPTQPHIPPTRPVVPQQPTPPQAPISHVPPVVHPTPPQPPVPPTQPVVPQHPIPPQAPISHIPPVHPTPPQQVPPSQQVPPKYSAEDISEDTEVSMTQTFIPKPTPDIPLDVPSSLHSKLSLQKASPESLSEMESLKTQDMKLSEEDLLDKSKGYRKKRTFAIPSDVRDINERVQPEQGSVIQVLVTWNERILNTLSFDSNTTVRIGSHPKNDIVLPIFSDAQDSHPLIKIKSLASLFITYEMRGVLVKGKERIPFDEMMSSGVATRSDTGFTIDLRQGELARVDFGHGLAVFVKYVAPSPKPLIGPFFDLTAKELNALVMAVGSTVIMAIFFLINYETIGDTPPKEEERERKAIFVYEPPPRPAIDPVPVKVAPKPKPKPVKKRRVKIDIAKKAKKAPKVVKRVTPQRGNSQKKVVKRTSEGKSGGAVKRVRKTNPKKVAVAGGSGRGNRKGGTRGAVAEGRKKPKDVSQSGLLGVFAKGGTQDQLRMALDGSGAVGGAAKRARGSGGSGGGSGLARGGGLAAVGRGGRGERTYGISGVQTKGGSGAGMKGSGAGLGGKANVRVVPGGDGESFVGVMDKNAIRRVVQRNINQLKFCYERLAQQNPNASGRVELGWDIKSGGRVGSVSVVTSQIKDRKMLDCMKRRLAAWRFPDPPEGVIGEITYPFVFAVSRQ